MELKQKDIFIIVVILVICLVMCLCVLIFNLNGCRQTPQQKENEKVAWRDLKGCESTCLREDTKWAYDACRYNCRGTYKNKIGRTHTTESDMLFYPKP